MQVGHGMRKVQTVLNMYIARLNSEFNVYQLVSGSMPDERWKTKPPPLEKFNFNTTVARFVKFQMLSIVSKNIILF